MSTRLRYSAALLAVSVLAGLPASVRADSSVWDLLRVGGPSRRGVASQVAAASPTAARGRRTGIAGIFDALSDTSRRVGKQLNAEIKAQGQTSTGFHLERVEGSQTSYRDSTYYGRQGVGGSYNNTDLTLQGKVAGFVNFETRYSNSAYGNPYDNRLSLNYATRGLKVDAGDIQGAISGNSLVDFSRQLKGIEVAGEVARGIKITSLYSQTRAAPRTITINGANRSGPYYVYAGMIVDGSDRVRVNDRELAKGEDFTLDPYTGELNFLKGLIVHEYDTIAVTFETYGYGQPAGVLTGWRIDAASIGGARVGAVMLSQESRQNSLATSYRTEQFYGYNNSATPYTLDYSVAVTLQKDAKGNVTGAVPIYPMTVLVGSVAQAYGIDYALDPLLPNRVFFKLPIPATQIVRISYVPASQNEIAGNRKVYGMDVGVALGKRGTLVAELAQSSLDYMSGAVSGAAWQVRGDLTAAKDRLRWNWTLRNISGNFTNVESAGFNRNDRGITTGFDYRASKNLQLTATIDRSKRPSYSYLGTGSSSSISGMDDYTQTSLRANWRLGSRGQLDFTHSSSQTTLSAGGASGLNSDMVTLSYTLKRVSTDFSFGRTLADARSIPQTTTGGAATGQWSIYRSDSLTSRASVRWQIANGYSLSTALSNSSVTDRSGSSTDATDVQLKADMALLRNLKLGLGYQLQNSGILTSGSSTSLFGGGSNGGLGGYGSYSGGLSSGVTTGLAGSSFGGKSHSVTANLNYQPAPSLTLDVNYGKSSSAGDYLFNSRRDDVALTTSYSPGEHLSLNATYNVQRVTYIGSEGGSSTNLLYFNARTRPIGKLSATMSYQMMTSSGLGSSSGSSTGTLYSSGGTDLHAYGMRLEYPVWRTHTLYAEFSNAVSSGYLASDQRQFTLGTDMTLSRNLHFVTGWRSQQYISRDTSTGAASNYRVNSLDADFSVRF